MKAQITGYEIFIILKEVPLDFLQVVFNTGDDSSHATLSREPIKHLDVAIVILIQARLAEVIQKVDLTTDSMDQQVEVALQ